MSDESAATRLKRLRLRSMRRGIREMDLLLGAFARDGLERLPQGDLDAYEALLEEADVDLLNWITGQTAPPARHADLVALLAAGARAAAGPGRFETL